MGLFIYNALSRAKEEFVPLQAGEVRMYLCGITSSGPPHIGHARAFVAFDVVHRWLSRHHRVTFVRNYTDVDDKIIRAAADAGEDVAAFAERNIARFAADMALLGCGRPDVEPRVSAHIAEIVALIARLEARGYAYAAETGDVYFEVTAFAGNHGTSRTRYGALSGRTREVLNAEAYRAWAGGRLEIPPGKRSPFDFALWKAARPGEPAWDSPWGRGRPGWHIECSAMSMKYLGETFDIHGGGKDLLFPHHENERAQCCAATGRSELARYWMHNGFVHLTPERCPACGAAFEAVPASADAPAADAPAADAPRPSCARCGHLLSDEELKMSKSRGNFYPVREIIAHHPGEALRQLLLMSHYRSPVQFSHALLADTGARLSRVYDTLRRVAAFRAANPATPGPGFAATFGFDPGERFREAMDDDFNTARAIAALSDVFHLANELIERRPVQGVAAIPTAGDASRWLGEIAGWVERAGAVLGLWQQDPEQYFAAQKAAAAERLTISPEVIQALIEVRNRARQARDFATSDAIRQQLKARGIALKDSDRGTDWYMI